MLSAVDVLLKGWNPVALVASLEFVVLPVVARHDAAARWRAAPADHPETQRAGLGPVVDRCFLSGNDVSSGRQRVRPVMPEGWITAVVAEVRRRPLWQHEVLVPADRDGVDERRLRTGIRICDQGLEFRDGDKPPAQTA